MLDLDEETPTKPQTPTNEFAAMDTPVSASESSSYEQIENESMKYGYQINMNLESPPRPATVPLPSCTINSALK